VDQARLPSHLLKPLLAMLLVMSPEHLQQLAPLQTIRFTFQTMQEAQISLGALILLLKTIQARLLWF